MKESSAEFFRSAVLTPSPSGYEERIQKLVREYAAPFADSISTDTHGNVILSRNSQAAIRFMLAGHCDQIGMLITHIDENGYLYAETIGGWDPQQLVGQQMTVWTDQGPISGVISRKPIHLLNEKERQQVVQLEQMWIDIGAANKEDALMLVRIGDSVTLQLKYTELQNGRVCGPGMDNKTGMWVVVEALRRARSLNCAMYSVSTVQEEIGLRGAKTAAGGIDPQIAIAVDVTHATDCPSIDKNLRGDIRLGRGPVVFRGPNMNPKVTKRLIDVAGANQIQIQIAASGKAVPNDANVLQIHGRGVAAGLVSIPNRYMHSATETVDWADLESAAELLARFAESLSESDHWIP
jgi:endoglucanase